MPRKHSGPPSAGCTSRPRFTECARFLILREPYLVANDSQVLRQETRRECYRRCIAYFYPDFKISIQRNTRPRSEPISYDVNSFRCSSNVAGGTPPSANYVTIRLAESFCSGSRRIRVTAGFSTIQPLPKCWGDILGNQAHIVGDIFVPASPTDQHSSRPRIDILFQAFTAIVGIAV